MHSGLIKLPKNLIGYLCVFVVGLGSCKDRNASLPIFVSPIAGDNVSVGKTVFAKISVSDPESINTIQYLVDGKSIGNTKRLDSVAIPTKDLRLGYRIITAVVTRGDQTDTISTNIVLKASQAPIKLTYQVLNTFPHSIEAYTEGLSYVDGKLLESTGEKSASQLKYVNLQSGEDLQQIKLPSQYFGEGSVKIDDKIIMLTWQENLGFVFDAKTFKQLGTFPYEQSREGWGLTFDGKKILRSDGSNRIWFMNAKTYKEEGFLEVYDANGAVDSLNELEYINGKIFANVYLTNKIVQINPTSGAVEAELDLSALVPKNFFKTAIEEQNNVLNGIAWDEKGKRLFITGKKWPKLYEIKLSK